MKRRTIIKLAAVTVLSALCASAVSCMTHRQEPDYLIKCGTDAGFMIASRDHFAVTGDTLQKISGSKFEKYIYGTEPVYKRVSEAVYSFELETDDPDCTAWDLPQQVSGDEDAYDAEALSLQLKAMGVSFTGKVYIQVTRFDDCSIVQAVLLDGNTQLDAAYGLFRNGQPCTLPRGTVLSSVREVYQRE